MKPSGSRTWASAGQDVERPEGGCHITVQVDPLQHAVVVLATHKPLVDREIVVDLEAGIEPTTVDVHVRNPDLAGNAPALDKQNQPSGMLLRGALGARLEAVLAERQPCGQQSCQYEGNGTRLTLTKPGWYSTSSACVKWSISAVDSRVVLSSAVIQFEPRPPKLRPWQLPLEGTMMVVCPLFGSLRMMRSVA